jgi:hypothetical protein
MGVGRVKGRVKVYEYISSTFILRYKNRTMKPAKIVLGRRQRR